MILQRGRRNRRKSGSRNTYKSSASIQRSSTSLMRNSRKCRRPNLKKFLSHNQLFLNRSHPVPYIRKSTEAPTIDQCLKEIRGREARTPLLQQHLQKTGSCRRRIRTSRVRVCRRRRSRGGRSTGSSCTGRGRRVG